MGKLARFRVVYEEDASEFIFAQGKAKGRQLLDICHTIGEYPFAEADYILPDEDGRPIAHVSTEGYVIGYWVEMAVKRVVIIEIEREE